MTWQDGPSGLRVCLWVHDPAYIYVFLCASEYTFTGHLHEAVCSLEQKWMPVCVCVFPMKNIQYMCVSVIYASPRCLGVCQLQMCRGQSRAGLPDPDVSRCVTPCSTDSPQTRTPVWGSDTFSDSLNMSVWLYKINIEHLRLNKVIMSLLLSLAGCGCLYSYDSCVRWYLHPREQDPA